MATSERPAAPSLIPSAGRSIFVVSDATGETAERVVRAALLQYPKDPAKVRLFTRVRDRDAVRDVLKRAADAQALVVFTLVSPELRDFCHETARSLDVEAVDVIGTLIGKVGTFLGATPLNMPSVTMPLSDDYFRRVEAIEFAVKSDDGREPRNLKRAELILVGVSRTSKTPLSTYLAGRGIRVANVPLVLGVPPPGELFEVPPERVIGLRLDVEKLVEIRRARLAQLGMPAETNYAVRDHVRAELEYAEDLFKDNPQWMVVNVSGRAIEETATIILESIKEREEKRAGTTTSSGTTPATG